MGIAIGIREIGEQLKEMVKSTVEAAVEIGHLNQQTGISVENLSMLKYAAQATGVDFDVLTRGFKKLAVTTYDADNGNKKAAAGFAQLGISVEEVRAKGDDMYGVLNLLAEKFRALPDGIAKSDAAAKIFGARMGAEMIPILNQLGGKLEELKAEATALGVVWDEQGIRKMEEMRREAVQLEAVWKAVGMRITEALARLVGVSHETLSAERAVQVGKTLPNDIAGADDPGKLARDSAARKSALEKSLSDLDAAHARGVGSEQDYQKKRAAIIKEWNEADLRENQSYFTDLGDQIANAEAQLAKDKKRKFGNGYAGDWDGKWKWKEHVKEEEAHLKDLLARQDTAMDQIDSAEKRASSMTVPGGGGDGGGGGGKGAGKVKPESEPLTVDTDALDQADLIAKAALQRKMEEFRRDSGQWFQDEDWKQMLAGLDTAKLPNLQSTLPNVVLGKQGQDYTALKDAGEKFAHGIFDPLFDVSERWDQRWKQMRSNMLRDLAQAAEGQLFGALFGDPDGRGGKGLSGGSWEGNPNKPTGRTGLAPEALGALGSLFHHKGTNVTSNGGVGQGGHCSHRGGLSDADRQGIRERRGSGGDSESGTADDGHSPTTSRRRRRRIPSDSDHDETNRDERPDCTGDRGLDRNALSSCTRAGRKFLPACGPGQSHNPPDERPS